MEYTNLNARDELYISIIPVSKTRLVTTIAVCSICLLLSWIATVLRLYTRSVLSRALGKDDGFMLITTCLLTIYISTVIANASLAKNTTIFSGQQIDLSTTLLIIAELMYIITMMFLKLSLAFFFLRIMVNRWQKWSVYIIVAVSTLASLGFFFFTLLACGTPITARLYWLRRIAGQCVSYDTILKVAYAHAGLTSGTDLALALLPIPMIRKSGMSSKEKRIVVGILLVAILGFTASLVRINWIPVLASTELTFWREIVLLAIWSAVEPTMGIIAACLATLRPLLRKVKNTSRLSSYALSNNPRGRYGNSKASSAFGGARSLTPHDKQFDPIDVESAKEASSHISQFGNAENKHRLFSIRSESVESLTSHTYYNATPKLEYDNSQASIYTGKQTFQSEESNESAKTQVDFNFGISENPTSSPRSPVSSQTNYADRKSAHRATWFPLATSPLDHRLSSASRSMQ